ncbi:MAG: type VI secretion system tube protein Hcp [Candidatus Thiodiazotropha sp.]
MVKAKCLFYCLVLIALQIPLSAMAQSGVIELTVEFADGAVERSSVDGFTIGHGGESKVALLLPAVQTAREAARRMEKAITKDELIPNITIETTTEETYYQWKLKNVRVTSYSMHAGSSAGKSVPVDDFSLNYEKMMYSSNGESKQYDCSSNTCILQTDSAGRYAY